MTERTYTRSEVLEIIRLALQTEYLRHRGVKIEPSDVLARWEKEKRDGQ